MIGFDEAWSLAKSCRGDVDYCMEYGDAFVFSRMDEEPSFGGNGPVVVLKDTGECINMVSYVDEERNGAEFIREGHFSEFE